MAYLVPKSVSGRRHTTIVHNIPSDAELHNLFDGVPTLEKYRVFDLVLAAASRPIAKWAARNTPIGTEEDRAKRSKSQRRSADWVTHLADTISYVVRKNFDRNRATSFIGPKYERRKGRGGPGSKMYLISEWDRDSRQVKYWGHDPKNGPERTRKMRNIMVDAANATRGQQLEAMKRVLKRELHAIWTTTWRTVHLR